MLRGRRQPRALSASAISTQSEDVDDAKFVPGLLQLGVGNFCVPLAGESDGIRVSKTVRAHLRHGQCVFAGLVSPIVPVFADVDEIG